MFITPFFKGDFEIQLPSLPLPQISPFPYDILKDELQRFPQARPQWVQEEHKNMGAWFYVQPRIDNLLSTMPERPGKASRLTFAGRPPSAASATGIKHLHLREMNQLIEEAMNIH